MTKNPHHLKVAIVYIIVCIVWGSTLPAVKVAVESIHPLFFVGMRTFIAGLIMLSIAFILKRPFPKKLSQYVPLLVIGLLMLVGANGLVAVGEQTEDSTMAIILVSTGPLWTALLSYFWHHKDRLPLYGYLGILIGFAGVVYLLAPSWNLFWEGGAWHGKVLLSLSPILWAIGMVYSREHFPKYDSFVAVSIQMLSCGVVLLTLFLPSQIHHLGAITSRSWLALFYLVIFGSCIGLFCYMWLIKQMAPAKVSTTIYMNLLITFIIGSNLLGEVITLRMWVAAVIILGSVFVVQLSVPKKPKRVKIKEEEIERPITS